MLYDARKLEAPARGALRVRRIQLSGEKGWKMPAKVDRSTIYGIPFPVEKYGRA